MGAKRVLFVTPSPKKKRRTRSPTRVARSTRRASKTISRRRPKRFKSVRARKNEAGLSRFQGPRCKTVARLDQPVTSFTTRSFQWTNLCAVAYDGTNKQNKRSGPECEIIGTRHVMNWQNLSSAPVKIYNYWIVPKQWKPETSTADLVDDFYTRHGLDEDTDGSWASDLATYLYDEPVNPDKYTVVKTAHFTLAPGNYADGAPFWKLGGTMTNYKKHKMWIPLNRKFTYGSVADAGETTLNPLQPPLLHVCFGIFPMTTDGVEASNLVLRESHVITFFRDGTSGMKS